MREPERRNISGNSPWEPRVGYSRAVRVGAHIFVSGTTAVGGDGTVAAADDAYTQAKEALRTIERALAEAGGTLDDVVRTRIFVTDIANWEEVGRAHREVFGTIRPATTMVEVSRLIDPAMLVEIEADAVVRAP